MCDVSQKEKKKIYKIVFTIAGVSVASICSFTLLPLWSFK